MEWTEAIELLIARTSHERYRALCADAHPDRAMWRRLVIEKVTGESITCPSCPCPASCLRQYSFCRSAAGEPQDEKKLRTICVQSGHRGLYAIRAEPPGPRPAGLARELVVSRYREDIGWLEAAPADMFLSVYAKSPEPCRLTRQARIERLPNVGREAHAYLHNIVTCYDDLAEWTYLLQADAPRHAHDIIGRLGVAYRGLCTLTRDYIDNGPSGPRPGSETVGGFEVRHGEHAIEPAVWSHVFACPRPEPCRFGYAAMWAVPLECIARRPLSLWRWLLGELVRPEWESPKPDMYLTPWTMEMIWWYLLLPPDQYPHREHAAPERPVYPPLVRQAKNAAMALGRMAAAAIRREPIVAPPEIVDRRRAICGGCDFNGEKASGGIRCTVCGCHELKLMCATERCPKGYWEAIKS